MVNRNSYACLAGDLALPAEHVRGLAILEHEGPRGEAEGVLLAPVLKLLLNVSSYLPLLEESLFGNLHQSSIYQLQILPPFSKR